MNTPRAPASPWARVLEELTKQVEEGRLRHNEAVETLLSNPDLPNQHLEEGVLELYGPRHRVAILPPQIFEEVLRHPRIRPEVQIEALHSMWSTEALLTGRALQSRREKVLEQALRFGRREVALAARTLHHLAGPGSSEDSGPHTLPELRARCEELEEVPPEKLEIVWTLLYDTRAYQITSEELEIWLERVEMLLEQ